MTETERVAQGLIECTLPKADWTHQAHLRAGLWHVHAHGGEQALVLLRERISRYNESVGTANTDSSGYHETLTRFYVLVIEGFLAGTDRTQPVDRLADRLIAARGDRQLPLQHYSKNRLFSIEARRNWVEPDLKAIG